jgi:hypothetical protein
MTRRTRRVAGCLLGLVAVALLAIVINLRWFDEALLPELVALRDSRATTRCCTVRTTSKPASRGKAHPSCRT